MHNHLIYQVYVGNSNPLYDFCINSVAQYCNKFDIEHIVLKEPILKIVPVNSKRSSEAISRLGYLPIYEKENAFAYLDQYDSICILDSDIYISPHAPNVFNELSDPYEFAAVVERDMPITSLYKRKITKYSEAQYGSLRTEADFLWNDCGAEFFNMGMMLVSNKIRNYLHNQTPKEFIQRPEFERFVNGEGAWKWSTDQTLLNYWVKKEKINTLRLDWKWNALYRGIKDEFLPQSYFLHFFLSDHIPKDISLKNLVNEIFQ